MFDELFDDFFCPEADVDIDDDAQKERARLLNNKVVYGHDLSMEDALWLDAWNLAHLRDES